MGIFKIAIALIVADIGRVAIVLASTAIFVICIRIIQHREDTK